MIEFHWAHQPPHAHATNSGNTILTLIYFRRLYPFLQPFALDRLRYRLVTHKLVDAFAFTTAFWGLDGQPNGLTAPLNKGGSRNRGRLRTGLHELEFALILFDQLIDELEM